MGQISCLSHGLLFLVPKNSFAVSVEYCVIPAGRGDYAGASKVGSSLSPHPHAHREKRVLLIYYTGCCLVTIAHSLLYQSARNLDGISYSAKNLTVHVNWAQFRQTAYSPMQECG